MHQILKFKNSTSRKTEVSCDIIERTLQRYNLILLNLFIDLCKTQFQINYKINKLLDIILLFNNCLNSWNSIKIQSKSYKYRINGMKQENIHIN
jgi:hypothetical protein